MWLSGLDEKVWTPVDCLTGVKGRQRLLVFSKRECDVWMKSLTRGYGRHDYTAVRIIQACRWLMLPEHLSMV